MPKCFPNSLTWEMITFLTRISNSFRPLLFTACEPLIEFGGVFKVLLRKNWLSLLNHVLTKCAVQRIPDP